MDTNVLEEPAVSMFRIEELLFYPEDGGSKFL
jgi:hypothetical protein